MSQTWVFPFDRPAPPAEGDDQALAVTTEDGSVAYDVAFALVWVDEDAVLNRNEAHALARCRDRRTVAVAFQVVLVLGSARRRPAGPGRCGRHACIECVTYALATQLVISLPAALSDDAARDPDAIWAEPAEFGGNVEDVPPAGQTGSGPTDGTSGTAGPTATTSPPASPGPSGRAGR